VGTGVLDLFKFGEGPNIEKFCRLGQLFMQPLHELRSLEADELRGDKNEASVGPFTMTKPSSKRKSKVRFEIFLELLDQSDTYSGPMGIF
jgi:hypothetical protein